MSLSKVTMEELNKSMGFQFDETTHTYFLNGRVIPGITYLLKYYRYIDDRYYTERGREIGKAVHLACHYADKGTLNLASIVNDEVHERMVAYQKFLKDKHVQILQSEERYCFPGGLFACTIDRQIMMDNERAIMEIKCGARAPWHALQTAMQKKCVQAQMPLPMKRYALYLHKDGTYDLRIHDDISDESVGYNLALDYAWRVKNGYPE